MKKLLLSIFAAMAAFGNVSAETGILYSGLNETDAEIDWTFDNVSMPEAISYVWNWKNYNDKYYLNGSGYKQEAFATESYAISPVIDLSDATVATLTFDHAAKFQTTLKDLCGVVVRLDGETSWTNLVIPTWPEAGSWTFVSSGDINLNNYAGKKIQLGFKYGSTTTGADTWEIKNVKITAEQAENPPVVDPDPEPTPGDESTKENPYTVTKAIELGISYNKAAWVKGYIVGWIDTNNNNAYHFDATATGNTNIIIAASANEKDKANCMPVQLPSGAVRNAINLQDNPDNYGKELLINAYITKYFGVPGLKKDGDATYEYTITGEGMNPPVVDPTPGDESTKENPFTVTKAIELGISYNKAAWVKGYIVGWIDTENNNTYCFNATATGNTNIIIAASANEKDKANCMPVQLPSGAVRNALNLQDNPDNYGKELLINAYITKYFGVPGLKKGGDATYEYTLTGEGVTPPVVDPEPVGNVLYSALEKNADDWTFDNVSMPENLTFIWKWSESYLKGSGYKDIANASESYAISPVIDLTEATSAALTFDHAARFQTTLKELCGVMVRLEGATSWTALSIPTWPEAGSWTFVSSGDISLDDYTGKKIQLAFKYGSTAEGADTWEIKNLKITGEGGEPVVPPVVETAKFVKATSIESGKKYVFVADGTVATGVVNQGGGTYGYIPVEDVTVENDAINVNPDYALTITAEDEGYNIVNAAGKYFAMKGTFNSFNLYDTPEESYIWIITFNAAGEAEIVNLDMEKTILYAPTYKSYGAYAEQGNNILPTLYRLDDAQSGVTDITVDNDAPVEYFNLQGIRVNVETAAPGLYIRRQGNTVSKILVK